MIETVEVPLRSLTLQAAQLIQILAALKQRQSCSQLRAGSLQLLHGHPLWVIPGGSLEYPPGIVDFSQQKGPGIQAALRFVVGDAVLRLPEQSGGALERAPEAFSERARYACRVYCGAPHRARLMRALTAGLMEAGADLTDGLTVRTVPGGVHIAPCADRAALCIESDSPDTARRFEALVRDVERRVENETGGSA